MTENVQDKPGIFLSSRWLVQTVADQRRKGMQRLEKSRQETMVQPRGRVLLPLQGIHRTISLSSFAELKSPTKEKKREGSPELVLDPKHQLWRRKPSVYPDPYLCPCCLLPNSKSTSSPPPREGTVFWGLLCLAKQSSYFCLFTPNSVSTFYWALLDRGWVLATTTPKV